MENTCTCDYNESCLQHKKNQWWGNLANNFSAETNWTEIF